MSQKISVHDIHPFDRYVKAFSNHRFVISLSVLAFFAGIALSLYNNNWLWFSRFGSIVTVSGLLLTMSPVFYKGIYMSQSDAGIFADLDEQGNTMTTNEDDRRVGRSVFTGIVISVIGTLIWGFGDLLSLEYAY